MTCEHSPTMRLHVAMLGGEEHCPSCLAARLAEVESECDAAARGHDAAHAECLRLEVRLAEAEALLREVRTTVRLTDLYNGGADENGLWTLPDRIDAFLKEGKP